jgi:hypothetical protein
MIIPDPEFEIDQIVYHITPESEPGTVLDMLYHFGKRRYEYLVTTGWSSEVWATEKELSETKVFAN